MISADDGADRVVVAIAVDPWANGLGLRRWYVNLREVTDGNDVLRHCVDDAVAEALGGPLQGAVHVVVDALLLAPAFSGPTRSRCDDPRLLALVRKAVLDGLPAIDAREKWLRSRSL